jgi:hypothetical protein
MFAEAAESEQFRPEPSQDEKRSEDWLEQEGRELDWLSAEKLVRKTDRSVKSQKDWYEQRRQKHDL